ncbi:hypothetical protein [Ensifer adhaerens]|jgi:hypothetical protein|uniref:hypothetical protein n=1 Tax=Ensifer adhaerens TaxID=106592 RepID=UPI00202F1C14|nr:hypothetical protein [Ensifer adhaerens]
MTFKALADSFSEDETLPVRVDVILDWIRANTDHQDITLHGVTRSNRAFRGGFRRRSIPKGMMYGGDHDIITEIFYGDDLSEDWKRLVIVKEALHVFDGTAECVDTPDKLRLLIPSIISNDLRNTFLPAMNDQLGAFRAMVILIPEAARVKLAAAVEAGTRTVEEVANYTQLPTSYVDLWIRYGHQIRNAILGDHA